MNTDWNHTDPPKYGTRIVAFGRIIFEDAFSTTVEPFHAFIIHWQDFDSGHSGWEHNGLSLIQCLEDEVKVDFWMPVPAPLKEVVLSEMSKNPWNGCGEFDN